MIVDGSLLIADLRLGRSIRSDLVISCSDIGRSFSRHFLLNRGTSE